MKESVGRSSAGAELAPEGLRERKKRRTRRAISDIATRLFAERGFEAVTLAEIAEASEVSVKTVLNYFGSKEELYFDRGEEVTDTLIAALQERPEGVAPLAALRRLLCENFVPFPNHPWRTLNDPTAYEHFRDFLSVEEGSPALSAYRLVLQRDLEASLHQALAAELGRSPDEPTLCALTAMLGAALALRERTLRHAVLERQPPARIRRRVTAIVAQCLDRLATAFDDLLAGPAGGRAGRRADRR
jgi:AcrR family transcriptional regulator